MGDWRWIAWVMVAIGAAVMLTFIVAESGIATLRMNPDDELTRDATFMGAATILGLVAFGTLLNTLFMRSSKPPYSERDVIPLMSGVIITAIASSMLLLVACCGNATSLQFTVFIFLMLIGMLLVLVGASQMLIMWLKRWKQDDPTDSPPTWGNHYQ